MVGRREFSGVFCTSKKQLSGQRWPDAEEDVYKRQGHFLALMRKKGGDDGEARTEHGGVRGTADKGIFRSTDKGILPPIDPGTVRKRARAVEKEKELDVFLGQSGVEWDLSLIHIYPVCHTPLQGRRKGL